jgi:hypothetical protein
VNRVLVGRLSSRYGVPSNLGKHEVIIHPQGTAGIGASIGVTTRAISDSIRTAYEGRVVPVYNLPEERDAEYRAGDRAALVAVIENLEIVSEDDLTWEQIVEVRKDADALVQLRRLRHWLDRDFVGKSRAFVEDEIALRLTSYNESLRKHGLKSVVGALSATLDSKILIGGPAAIAALSYAGGPTWALIGGASVVVGRVAVHVAEKLIEYRELKNQTEVSFLAQLKHGNAA